MTNKKQVARSKRDLLDAVSSMMLNDQGRLFLTWLLESCHLYQCSYSNGEPRCSSTDFLEGERNIGLMTVALMNERPEEYLIMLQKNMEETKVQKEIKASQQTKEGEENE